MTASPALEKAMVTKPITLHLMPREDGGLRIKADELPGLILSNMDQAALFRDLPEVIRDLIAHGGYTPSLPSGGDVGEIQKRLNKWIENCQAADAGKELHPASWGILGEWVSVPREKVQAIVDDLNDVIGTIDQQTYEDVRAAQFDRPDDAESTVIITAKQERSLEAAWKILNGALATAALGTQEGEAKPAATTYQQHVEQNWGEIHSLLDDLGLDNAVAKIEAEFKIAVEEKMNEDALAYAEQKASGP